MPSEVAIHATAVAIGGRALVVVGPSRSGKSGLAAALIARSSPARPIVLVGDDRVLLARRADGGVVARPHPRIAGFIERRGLGLVAMPWRDSAVVAGLVLLADAPAPDRLGNLPALRLVGPWEGRGEPVADRVLAWWETNTIAKIGIGKENALVYTRLPERAAVT